MQGTKELFAITCFKSDDFSQIRIPAITLF